MTVSKLAKELGVGWKDVVTCFNEENAPKSHLNKLTDEQIEIVKKTLGAATQDVGDRMVEGCSVPPLLERPFLEEQFRGLGYKSKYIKQIKEAGIAK